MGGEQTFTPPAGHEALNEPNRAGVAAPEDPYFRAAGAASWPRTTWGVTTI
jgi:hypothetical protein